LVHTTHSRRLRLRCLTLAVCALAATSASAQGAPEASGVAAPIACLAEGDGFFRARLQGTIDADLNWANADTECTGAVRPDGGIRLGFSRAIYEGNERLVILIGIAGLKEGAAAKALPVNVTVIRQGTGQFFGTQGDDKCMLDEVVQRPLTGVPFRNRVYKVVGRGFCTPPARSVAGPGAVLLTRFDFAGRIDFSADAEPDGQSLPLASERPQ